MTIAAVDNDERTPGGAAVTVSATAVNTQGFVAPEPVTLTIQDDEAPTVTLHLSREAIMEAGGVSRVTARLSHPSGAETVVAVSVAPVQPAEAGDYRLDNSRLTVPAGETESAGRGGDHCRGQRRGRPRQGGDGVGCGGERAGSRAAGPGDAGDPGR